MAQVKNSVAKPNAALLSEYQTQSRQGLSLGRKQMLQNIACRQVCDLLLQYGCIPYGGCVSRDALQCVSTTFLTECLILATLFLTKP